MIQTLSLLLLLLCLPTRAQNLPPAPTHYKGREIAQTMHYTGAEWLIRETRESEEASNELLALLHLEPGMTVCDLGCGNGYHAIPIARKVGPEGKVLAVDIQPEMLEYLEVRAATAGVENIQSILGGMADPHLPPGQVDLVLMVDVYHEFAYPEQMLRAIRESLAPGGRIALVEFRAEDPKVPIKPLHKMSKEQILKEYLPNGFKLVEQFDGLPWQHLMFFEKDEAWAGKKNGTSKKSEVRKANREPFAYLEEDNPFYPDLDFPKLVTPQWVGEEGVEAVVILSIDDLGDPQKYEDYLRPILDRLKQIEGRAPLSISTNKVDPNHPLLQKWISEGVTLDAHTTQHKCPMMAGSDLAAVKADYDQCLDLIFSIPNNKPVAFRVPCCDSMNATSPRFYTEIFGSTTEQGHFLKASSSVFNLFTSDDPELPRNLVQDANGTEKFAKYLPKDRVFSNYIENYPYPYVVSDLCWEFPAAVPSDWEGQHYQQPNSPFTVEDLKAALDATVIKQGVFTFCFHPHGWIENTQVVELIDHAVHTHGSKIKFLTFAEAVERLELGFLNGFSLRYEDGYGTTTRVLDLNGDGLLDNILTTESETFFLNEGDKEPITIPARFFTQIWNPKFKTTFLTQVPLENAATNSKERYRHETKFAKTSDSEVAAFSILSGTSFAAHRLRVSDRGLAEWKEEPTLIRGLEEVYADVVQTSSKSDTGIRFRDLDGDGATELIAGADPGGPVFRWIDSASRWEKLPFTLPENVSVLDTSGRDAGLRFVDLNEDGLDDIVFSNQERYGVYLLTGMDTGWSVTAQEGRRSENPKAIPSFVREGRCNGAWFAHRTLWVSNEDTDTLPGKVFQATFKDLMGESQPFGTDARGSLLSLHTRPGFEVELVASEPLVMDPIALDWGMDGKLWVVEMADYPDGLENNGEPGGRVRYLEDTDGNGTYDRSTVFVDKLAYPSGVMAYKKGVLVASAPDLFYAEDTDGDGTADHREVLYTGFGSINQQHLINGMRWGLDNWIYLANGDSGGEIRSIKTGQEADIRNRDLRIRPETGEMETLYGQTQFGRERDDFDNWFGCANPNPGWHYVLIDRYISRNPHIAGPSAKQNVSISPGTSPVFPASRTLARFNDVWMVNRFTSACGISLYRDRLLGEHFIGNTFVCEPVHNLVHRERVSPEGVTFTSDRAPDEKESEFLASADNWFRPTITRTGPDGALWVVDMDRAHIEHTAYIPKEFQVGVDFREGDTKGRIYRVYPVDREPRPMRRLDTLNDADLVAVLESQSGTERDLAQRLLIERNSKETVPLLENLVAAGKEPTGRVHSLCTLEGLGALREETLFLALSDPHPGVSRQAVRLSEPHLGSVERIQRRVVELAREEEASVRLQVAYSLGEADFPLAGKGLADILLEDGDDPYLAAAAFSSLNSTNLGQVVSSILSSPSEVTSQVDLFAPLLEVAVGFGNQAALESLLAKVSRPEGEGFPSWQMDTFAGFLDGLERKGSTFEDYARSVGRELQETLEKNSSLFALAEKTAKDAEAPEDDRLLALRLLGRRGDHLAHELGLLGKLLDPVEPLSIQTGAVETLANLSSDQVPSVLLSPWKNLGPEVRSKVLSALLSNDPGTEGLLAALEGGKVAPVEVEAAYRQRLLAHANDDYRARAEEVFSKTVESDRAKVIEAYRPVTELVGNAEKGKETFKRLCASCHALKGEGRALGPDLAAITDKSPNYLLVNVLDPNRSVETKFLNYLAETFEGDTFTGLLTSESGNSLTLAGADGSETVILRADLTLLRSTHKSFMPEGLEAGLAPQDVADLFAFVAAGSPPDSQKPVEKLIQPEAYRGEIWLLAQDAALHGKSLALQSKFNNLGNWTDAGDYASWRFQVTEDMDYAVVMDYACADNPKGNAFEIHVAGEKLSGVVEGSGDPNRYGVHNVGWLHLVPGEYRLLMRPTSPLEGPLMDLKGIGIQPSWMHR